MANLVDSSVWVALFLDFDTQHTKAEKLWTQLQERVYLPHCVINEVVTVLAYKHSKEQADQFIEFVVNAQNIEFLEDSLGEEISWYKEIKARISFTDAALLLLAQKLKLQLVTFDVQLKNLAKKG